jgi:hypothetical protein
VLREPYQAHLLPSVLLIPLGVAVAPKVWERPALGAVAIVILLAVPWRTGGEEAELAHVTAPDIAAAALAGIVAVRTLVIGDQGRLRSWVVLPLMGIVLRVSRVLCAT